ncbi:MAG: MFS transporter, partial [Puniceicoccales bacterium]|jgi:sugar phosphate permease|nr:MFS transporter [Puniceicoccales bacterium]
VEQTASISTSPVATPSIRWNGLVKNPSLWILFVHVSLLASAFWLCNGWLPVFLKENFSMGLGNAGISATGFVQTASFAGILIGGWWADRWFRTNRNARIFVPLIGFLIAAPAFAGMACTSVLAIAVFGMIIFGLARGFSDANLMPLVCQIVPDNQRATAYGILNLSGCLTGGLLIYAGGYLRDHGFNLSNAFLTAAGMMFIAACLLLLLRNKTPAAQS